MTVSLVQNFYKQTVTTPWTTGVGNFYVSTKPTVTSGFLVISPNSESLREIVSFSAVGTDGGGDYVTVSARGLGGTTEQAHGAGEKVYMNITAQHVQQIKEAIEAINNAGALNASTAVKGVARLTTSPNVSLGNPTITIATPAVVTLATHGLTENDEIQFTTTGTLPTGITSGATYFVIATDLTANTFKFSATFGGPAVDTSGSQSGTHTLTRVTPRAVSDTDTRIPSVATTAALLGAGETPGAGNKFLTQNDVDNPSLFPIPVVKVRTLNNVFGDSTTQFDITNPAGTTYRYTYDATGTNPNISAATVPVGTELYVNAQNFAAANNGAFIVTGSGANYFEVTNAAGVVESNRTLGTGNIRYCYIKPALARFVTIEMVGAGGGGCGADTSTTNSYGAGGASAGWLRKLFAASALDAFEPYIIGIGGAGSASSVNPPNANDGTATTFKTLTANGGKGAKILVNDVALGGTATGGDVNVQGEPTSGAQDQVGALGSILSKGGRTSLGDGGRSSNSGTTNQSASGYGSGGRGGNLNSGANGDTGQGGAIVITEYF